MTWIWVVLAIVATVAVIVWLLWRVIRSFVADIVEALLNLW